MDLDSQISEGHHLKLQKKKRGKIHVLRIFYLNNAGK